MDSSWRADHHAPVISLWGLLGPEIRDTNVSHMFFLLGSMKYAKDLGFGLLEACRARGLAPGRPPHGPKPTQHQPVWPVCRSSFLVKCKCEICSYFCAPKMPKTPDLDSSWRADHHAPVISLWGLLGLEIRDETFPHLSFVFFSE